MKSRILGLLAVGLLAGGHAAVADTITFATDPFAGSTALTDPGRQVVGGEPSVTFNIASDLLAFNPAVFGIYGAISFANGIVANLPSSGLNVVVLQTFDNDADAGTPFGAGNAANLIAAQITSPGAGFFIYFNSGLDLPRLVFSPDLSDFTADLKILARFTNLGGQAGRDAIPTFTAANFSFLTVPEPGTLALLGLGLTGLALSRRRKLPVRPTTADAGRAHVRQSTAALILAALIAFPFGLAHAATIVFEAVGSTPADLAATRDAFRAAIGGGTTAGPNGSFGGLRREINWDGVPDSFSDPNPLPANFFNVNSPRGVVFSTPGTGFLVSANSGGATPTLFGFPSDFQAFSAQKLFTSVNSNITDINFFLPGTTTAALVSAFGLIFVDVEVAALTRLDFFDATNTLIFSRDALVSGNQGFSFLGATFSSGGISRVRITAGGNTIVANGVLGNPNNDVVVMDDFIYSEPMTATNVPEPGSLALLGLGLTGLALSRKRKPA